MVSPRFPVALAIVTALSQLCGCEQTRVFRAENLPPEYAAAVPTNPRTVMLAKLAAPARATDSVEPGDVIHIEISVGLGQQETIGIPVRVDERGEIALPDVPKFPVGGKTLPDAESAVAQAVIRAEQYKNPRVTITMKRRRRNRITVVGAVKNPGVYELPRGASDLVSAIVAAGSLADDAGSKIEIRQPVDLRRERPKIAAKSEGKIQPAAFNVNRPARTINIDLVSAINGGRAPIGLNDGAVVMIERIDPDPIQVLGLVRKPGRFPVPPGESMTMLDALSLASGISSPVADRVLIIRRTENGPVVIEASIARAKQLAAANPRLAPGDVISIEQTAATVALDAVQMITFGLGAAVF